MAPALPKKMPAGSRPLSRRPSRPPSADSRAKLRWIASSALKVTANQNRPAAARVSRPRSGSRAKANSTSTSTANGAIWLSVTRDRSSIRRSLPATRAASAHMGAHPVGLRLVDLSAHDRQLPAGDGRGAVELVRREEHGRPLRGRLADEVVDEVTPGGVDAGVGLVEQPELGRPRHEHGQGGAAPLAGGEPGDDDV